MRTIRRSAFEDDILRSLRRIIRGVALHNKHLAQHYEITGPQLICLRILRATGPMTPSRLAAAASLSKPTISGIVDRLERRGLVTRERSTSDKRQVSLALTERGREVAFAAPPPLQERFAQNLALLSTTQQARIDRMLQRIVQMMEVKDLDAAPILDVAHAMSEADVALNGKWRAAPAPRRDRVALPPARGDPGRRRGKRPSRRR